MSKRVAESFEGLPSRVDKEKGIIYDALLLGPKSLNGNEYDRTLRTKCASKFENLPVNLSHEKRFNPINGKWEAVAAVDHTRRFGKVKNIHDTETGLRGNVHIMPHHQERDKILACAEDSEWNSMFCFSPVFDLIPDQSNPKHIIDIETVYSVDLVTFGGTTKTFYEEGEMPPSEDKQLHEEEKDEAEDVEQELKTLIEQITSEIVDFHDDHKDAERASSRIGAHLKHHAKMHLKEEKDEPKEDAKDEPKPEEEKAKEEEYRLLKAEKHARRVCEERQVEPSTELIDLLTQLPTDQARDNHVLLLKRQSLLTQAPAAAPTANDTDWARILRR